MKLEKNERNVAHNDNDWLESCKLFCAPFA